MPKKSHRVIHRRAKSHRRRTEPIAPHSILATLFGAGAALVPAIMPNPDDGGNSVVSQLGYAAQNAAAGDSAAAAYSLQQAGQNFENGLISGFWDIIGLAVGAVVVGWGGKKYGKSATNLDRKWRVI